VLLVFVGVWIGHMVEHVRVEGPAGMLHELTHSLHAYMLPLGAVLFVFATLTYVAWSRMVAVLTRRLGRASDALRCAIRGVPPQAEPPRGDGPVSPGSRWLALATCLTLAQIGLYGLQENIEHALGGEGVPAVDVFLGSHWAAGFVQATVACALAACVLLCRRRVVDLVRRIDAVERLARWLGRDRIVLLPLPQAWRARSFTPLERFGPHHLQRPPPGLRFSD
jgi:hypothetical protein